MSLIRSNLATHEQAAILSLQEVVQARTQRKDEHRTVSAAEATPERAPHPPTEHLQGIVERVTYHAEDSGYTVARLKVPSHSDLVTIVGRFPSISAGQTLRVTGFWREHAKFGQQFQVVHAQEMKPATLTGLEKYLGSGLIKGIGPVTARRIVAHFGLETLEVIEHSSSRLSEVPGIGQRRVAMIERAWEAQKAIKEVMLFLTRAQCLDDVHGEDLQTVRRPGHRGLADLSTNPLLARKKREVRRAPPFWCTIAR